MKTKNLTTKILLTFSLLLLSSFSFAQWEPQTSETILDLQSVFFTDNDNDWAVGEAHVFVGIWGTLLHSIDGGETWVKQDSIPPYSFPTSLPLRGVHFIDPDNGWVIGGSMAPSSGYIYCFIMNTNVGGIAWEEQINYSNIYPPLNSVCFTDNNNGWAVGGLPGWPGFTSIILHTINGGYTWEEQSSGTEEVWNSVCFTDAETGWIVGGSTILHTTDGGYTWEEQPSGTTEGLNNVCFIDPENGWIVGDTGTILHTDNGGIVQIPNYQNPNSKIHLKNYPNPFSTSTIIEYELSEPGTALIKIYNQTGQLIKEVEQGEDRIGKNYYTLQTNDLPPGIYFIRLQVGDEIITKKIIKL